nr:hypothetical protein [Candidatus Bathyarchaeota archaeon]
MVDKREKAERVRRAVHAFLEASGGRTVADRQKLIEAVKKYKVDQEVGADVFDVKGEVARLKNPLEHAAFAPIKCVTSVKYLEGEKGEHILTVKGYGVLGSFKVRLRSNLVAVKGWTEADFFNADEVYGFLECELCGSTLSPEDDPSEACDHIKMLLEVALAPAVGGRFADFILPDGVRALALLLAPKMFKRFQGVVDGHKVEAYETRYGYATFCMSCGDACIHVARFKEKLAGGGGI